MNYGNRAVFDISPSAAVLLDRVRRKGCLARAVLPDHTTLSQQSVHRLTKDLLSRGLLQTAAPKITGPGKPSPLLALRPDGAFGFGLAIDTDRVQIAVTDLVGTMLHHEDLPVAANDCSAVRDAARAAFTDLAARLALPPDRFAGLGVSMQGYRQTVGDVFVPPAPLPSWHEVNVVETFADAVPGPVYAENNGALGALAELWAGAGRRSDTFAYLSINYGLGGGLVLGGTPWLGVHGNAAEISAIYSAAELADRPALSGLLADLRAAGVDVSDVSSLRACYDPGWPVLDRWIVRVLPALTQMLRALTGIVDPEMVVFGGEAPRDLCERLIVAADLRRVDHRGCPVPGPQLVISEIDPHPNVLGAALLPIRRRLFR